MRPELLQLQYAFRKQQSRKIFRVQFSFCVILAFKLFLTKNPPL